MARKINLKGLHNTGDLIVTLTKGTVDAASQGFGAMFDNDPNLLTKFIGDNVGVQVTLNFNFTPSLRGKEFLIIIKCDVGTSVSASGIIISQGGKLLSKAQTVNTAAVYNIPTKANSLGSGLVVNFISTSDVEISDFQLFVTDEADPYEFNDSVLTTKAWNSSRYDGRQLQASKINLARIDDVGNNDRKPIIQNYSKNIYIGSRVMGMTEPGITGSFDDPTLTPFPGFSYITVDDYITVNSDDSVTRRSVRGGRGEGDDLNAKKGFYQAWYQDFPIGKKVQVKPLDKKLAQSLSPRYNVFNNSGQLQKMLLVTQHPAGETVDSGSYYAASYETSSFIFDYCSGSGNPDGTNDLGADFSIFNYLLLSQKFFTGSLIANPTPDGLGSRNI